MKKLTRSQLTNLKRIRAISSPKRALVLINLRENPEGLRLTDLAKKMATEPAGVSQMLRLLRDNGLVEVEHHGRAAVYRLVQNDIVAAI